MTPIQTYSKGKYTIILCRSANWDYYVIAYKWGVRQFKKETSGFITALDLFKRIVRQISKPKTLRYA